MPGKDVAGRRFPGFPLRGILRDVSSKRVALGFGDWRVVRWMLILRPAVVTATLGAAILVLPLEYIEQKTPILVVVLGTYLLTLLYWFAHYVSGTSRPLLALEIAFDIFIITVIIHYTGGGKSFFFGFYLLSIMCASLFFRRIYTFLFSTQASVFFAFELFVLEETPDDMNTVLLKTVLYILLIYAVGFISSYFAEKLRGKDTALMNALRLLREAKLDTLDILQSMTNGLITVDTHGRVIYMNDAAGKILQMDRERVGGRSYGEVFGGRAKELAEVIDRQMTSSTSVTEKEIDVLGGDGSTIPLGLSSMPLYDTDGSRRGVIVNFKDLTEKNKLLEMLRQSERMAAIGGLSSAIAHEIRNPLASINNAVGMLSESCGAGDARTAKLIGIIERESERLQKISTEFLRFARMNKPELRTLDLKQVIDEVVLLLENDPRNTDEVSIVNNIGEGVTVRFDGDQLKQLVLNVLINSLDALEGRGAIRIDAVQRSGGDGDFVRVVFSDTGPGFPEESLGSVFEPFFSTKKEGTGLGLALVRKIAVSNGGRVSARNREGDGAEIILDLVKDGE